MVIIDPIVPKIDTIVQIPQNLNDTIKISSPSGISLNKWEPLRQELLKIIDTKRTDRYRREIAEKVWSTYFYNKAYIDNLSDINDKNPEHWSPGNGKKYLTEHLALLPSIIDIKIISVDIHNETQKISGLSVMETNNGDRLVK